MLPPKAGRVCSRRRFSLIDGQTGAVRRQAAVQGRGRGPGQIASQAGRAHEDDLGLVFSDQLDRAAHVRLGAVVMEDRVVDQIDLVGAVGKGFLGQMLDVFAEDEGAEGRFQIFGQLVPHAEKLPADLGGDPVLLLDEDPDAAIAFIGPGFLFFLRLFFRRSPVFQSRPEWPVLRGCRIVRWPPPGRP